MDDLEQLAEWAAPLIRRLEPKARRALNRELARHLRRDQKRHIAAQQNPDGTPYAPRKPQGRRQSGAIKRQAMFKKLRTARYMRAKGGIDHASVGFSGRAAAIARVHQFGETSKVDENGPRYDYPTRRLLGFTPGSRDELADLILSHITGPL